MDASEPKDNIGERERRFDMELLKKGLRCDLDQYEMLKRCSDKKDMTEWNEWRKEHPHEDILLERARFPYAHLQGAYFKKGPIPDGTGCFTGKVHLEGAVFHMTHLDRAHFNRAFMQGAYLANAYLDGAVFYLADLRAANVRTTIVSGRTSFWQCKVDRGTDFTGTALDAARVDPATKQLLEYNIRRMNWEEWYKDENVPIEKGKGIFSNDKLRKVTNRLLRRLAREFWQISDYGISTKQIIKTFFAWALIFAGVYLAWGLIDYHLLGLKDNPGIVSNLFVLQGEQETVSPWLVPFRSVYFSIVTMTTLGFGDMYANAYYFVRGLFGHVLLALQVILGYVLLAALVTRFAVLFTAGGPAGRFANEQEEKDKT